jgi:hypothetical protein
MSSGEKIREKNWQKESLNKSSKLKRKCRCSTGEVTCLLFLLFPSLQLWTPQRTIVKRLKSKKQNKQKKGLCLQGKRGRFKSK